MNQQILYSSAVSEGTWTEIDPLISPFSIGVSGFASGDAAQIYVTNEYTTPSPAVAPVAGDQTMQLGDDITSDTMVVIAANFRWVRVRKSTAGGSPATTIAVLQGLTQTV
jgi:hypothetical protein